MGLVFPGYRGIAKIQGVDDYVRFGDANITAKQEINAPDLIMGDWDHDAYVYGKIEVGGTISGPVTENFVKGAGGLFPWAVRRSGECGTLEQGDIELWYYCGTPTQGSALRYRKFEGMIANSINFSCSAGDIAQFSLDVMGTAAGNWGEDDAPHYTSSEKLLTWDKVGVSIAGSGPGATEMANVNYSNFEFTISNNLEAVYSLAQENLFPFEIVPGLRTITGSLSVYNIPGADGVNTWDEYDAGDVTTITFNLNTLSVDMKVQLHRIEPAFSVGPIISTIGFTGVTHQEGDPWV